MFFVFRGIGRAWVAGLAQLVPSPNNNKKGEIKICNYNGGWTGRPPPLPPPTSGAFAPCVSLFFRCFEGGILYLNFRFLKVFPYCYRGKSTLNRVYRLILVWLVRSLLLSRSFRLDTALACLLQTSPNSP